MGTDSAVAALFDDVYHNIGHHPHRALLPQLLANFTRGFDPGSLASRLSPESLASGLSQALTLIHHQQRSVVWQAQQAQQAALQGGEGVELLSSDLTLGPRLPGWAAGDQHGMHSMLSALSAAGGGADDPAKGGPVSIGLISLLLAAALVVVNGLVSLWLRLGLHGKLAVATVRCIVQLSVLGYILVPIFAANRWWLTFLYTLFMLVVAAIEAVSRPSQSYGGMLPQVLLSLGAASSLVISYGLLLVVRVHPWYDPQYLIPMLGMMLGNACSGIAVGLSTVLDELSAGRDKVEMLLCMGASRQEASRELVQRAARIALTPILNQMSVVGIVSIPGMMTGQILGGSDPSTAARYQIVIMFLIGAATSVSAVGTIFMAVFSIIDDRHRLRSERLVAKAANGKGAVAWIRGQIKKAWEVGRARAQRVHNRMGVAFGNMTPRSRHRYLFREGGSLVEESTAGSYSLVESREEEGEEGGQVEGGRGEEELQGREEAVSTGARGGLQEVVVGGEGGCQGRGKGEGAEGGYRQGGQWQPQSAAAGFDEARV